jgi:IclR family transcriptional regulator, KDG regulon repressor
VDALREQRVSDGGLSSVGNAARLLKAFLSREKEIGVSELARRLDLGKSTVHRLLTTLVQEGLVERNPDTGAYRLALTMFELGQVVQSHMQLHGVVGPVLAALREETHEGCQVGVLDGHEVVYIDRLESSQTLRLFNETGRRVPVHTTSSGKVLLAHLSDEELDGVLSVAPLNQMTPRSITDPVALRAELAKVRARGWSEAVEEREIGVASIAAPIRDAAGRVVAAISIGGPAARMGAQQRRRLAEVVVEAGEAASRRLGWSPETRHLREG